MCSLKYYCFIDIFFHYREILCSTNIVILIKLIDFIYRSNMATNQNTPNIQDTFTDSIHSRFTVWLHCDTCHCDIAGNENAIKDHFNDTHSAIGNCCYCKGKVFKYQKITTVDCKQISQDFTYHKCDYQKRDTHVKY